MSIERILKKGIEIVLCLCIKKKKLINQQTNIFL